MVRTVKNQNANNSTPVVLKLAENDDGNDFVDNKPAMVYHWCQHQTSEA
jgi:hypothetical protein